MINISQITTMPLFHKSHSCTDFTEHSNNLYDQCKFCLKKRITGEINECKHICTKCGIMNDHFSSKCPLPKCNVCGSIKHTVHTCRNCNGNHSAKKCTKELKEIQKKCNLCNSTEHEIHICKNCGENHLTRNCKTQNKIYKIMEKCEICGIKKNRDEPCFGSKEYQQRTDVDKNDIRTAYHYCYKCKNHNKHSRNKNCEGLILIIKPKRLDIDIINNK